jgi:hypothetical protein
MSGAGWVNLCIYRQRDRLRVVQGGSFTYNTRWQFYVFRAERLIHRYRLNRRLCGSYRQSGVLEKKIDTFPLQN